MYREYTTLLRLLSKATGSIQRNIRHASDRLYHISKNIHPSIRRKTLSLADSITDLLRKNKDAQSLIYRVDTSAGSDIPKDYNRLTGLQKDQYDTFKELRKGTNDSVTKITKQLNSIIKRQMHSVLPETRTKMTDVIRFIEELRTSTRDSQEKGDEGIYRNEKELNDIDKSLKKGNEDINGRTVQTRTDSELLLTKLLTLLKGNINDYHEDEGKMVLNAEKILQLKNDNEEAAVDRTTTESGGVIASLVSKGAKDQDVITREASKKRKLELSSFNRNTHLNKEESQLLLVTILGRIEEILRNALIEGDKALKGHLATQEIQSSVSNGISSEEAHMSNDNKKLRVNIKEYTRKSEKSDVLQIANVTKAEMEVTKNSIVGLSNDIRMSSSAVQKNLQEKEEGLRNGLNEMKSNEENGTASGDGNISTGVEQTEDIEAKNSRDLKKALEGSGSKVKGVQENTENQIGKENEEMKATADGTRKSQGRTLTNVQGSLGSTVNTGNLQLHEMDEKEERRVSNLEEFMIDSREKEKGQLISVDSGIQGMKNSTAGTDETFQGAFKKSSDASAMMGEKRSAIGNELHALQKKDQQGIESLSRASYSNLRQQSSNLDLTIGNKTADSEERVHLGINEINKSVKLINDIRRSEDNDISSTNSHINSRLQEADRDVRGITSVLNSEALSVRSIGRDEMTAVRKNITNDSNKLMHSATDDINSVDSRMTNIIHAKLYEKRGQLSEAERKELLRNIISAETGGDDDVDNLKKISMTHPSRSGLFVVGKTLDTEKDDEEGLDKNAKKLLEDLKQLFKGVLQRKGDEITAASNKVTKEYKKLEASSSSYTERLDNFMKKITEIIKGYVDEYLNKIKKGEIEEKQGHIDQMTSAENSMKGSIHKFESQESSLEDDITNSEHKGTGSLDSMTGALSELREGEKGATDSFQKEERNLEIEKNKIERGALTLRDNGRNRLIELEEMSKRNREEAGRELQYETRMGDAEMAEKTKGLDNQLLRNVDLLQSQADASIKDFNESTTSTNNAGQTSNLFGSISDREILLLLSLISKRDDSVLRSIVDSKKDSGNRTATLKDVTEMFFAVVDAFVKETGNFMSTRSKILNDTKTHFDFLLEETRSREKEDNDKRILKTDELGDQKPNDFNPLQKALIQQIEDISHKSTEMLVELQDIRKELDSRYGMLSRRLTKDLGQRKVDLYNELNKMESECTGELMRAMRQYPHWTRRGKGKGIGIGKLTPYFNK